MILTLSLWKRQCYWNLVSDISELVIHQKNDSNVSSFIPTTKPIDAMVQTAKTGSVDDSDNFFDLP